MNRLDFYFRQRVTESELDQGFQYCEDALHALAVDTDQFGIAYGFGVAQQIIPNLTVKVAGPGAGYDQQGQRIAIASNQTVNCAVDFNNVSTSVVNGGNEKYVSVFAVFNRALTDPRVDGNAATVYFQRAESVTFKVVQGAEAAIGFAARPTLLADGFLLADVHLVNAQATIVNADIDAVTRRQDAYFISGTPYSLRRGRAYDAIADVLGSLNDHITSGGAGVHQAVSIAYAGGGAWVDGATNPAASAEAQFDKILSDLTLQTAAHAGADKLGAAATTGAHSNFSMSAGSIGAQLAAIATRLDNISTPVITAKKFATIAGGGAITAAGTSFAATADGTCAISFTGTKPGDILVFHAYYVASVTSPGGGVTTGATTVQVIDNGGAPVSAIMQVVPVETSGVPEALPGIGTVNNTGGTTTSMPPAAGTTSMQTVDGWDFYTVITGGTLDVKIRVVYSGFAGGTVDATSEGVFLMGFLLRPAP